MTLAFLNVLSSLWQTILVLKYYFAIRISILECKQTKRILISHFSYCFLCRVWRISQAEFCGYELRTLEIYHGLQYYCKIFSELR